MVTLTDIAATKVKELMNGQAEVPRRGCGWPSGAAAVRASSTRSRSTSSVTGDQVFEYADIRLLIDSESLPFVDGSEVDYVEGLQGAGFAVNNPNVVAACGCGQSFRTA